MELPDIDEVGVNTLRIIGIDPGTTMLGLSVIDVDIETLDCSVVWATTLDATANVDRKRSLLARSQGARAERLQWLSGQLSALFNHLDPYCITTESCFHKPGRTTAFEALIECRVMLLKTIWEYSPQMSLKFVDPVKVKNYVGVSHIRTDKEDVRRGLVNKLGSKFASTFKLDELDEHAIDATCVANTLYRSMILNEAVVSTKKPKKPKNKSGKRRRRSRRKTKGG